MILIIVCLYTEPSTVNSDIRERERVEDKKKCVEDGGGGNLRNPASKESFRSFGVR